MPKDFRSKIKTPYELVAIVQELRHQGKKIVHCHGVFDLVHPGHINYFEQAHTLGDVVYVTIVADRFVRKGLNRPRFSERIRLEWVAALEPVDYVVLNEEDGPWGIMRLIRPDIYTKGESEKSKLKNLESGLNVDKRTMEEIGGELCFTPEVEIHSTELFKALD